MLVGSITKNPFNVLHNLLYSSIFISSFPPNAKENQTIKSKFKFLFVVPRGLL